MMIDPGPQSSEHTLIEALGGEAPRAIVLTHIHLDHAGATGSLVRRWPDTPVFVHERGAPHLIDPSKLWASASQLWPDDMDERWGEVVPVPESDINLVGDGDVAVRDARRVHARARVPPRLLLPRGLGLGVRRRRRGRAHPAGRPHADADPAAGHRRRGLAGVARAGRVVGAADDRGHPLRRARGRRADARRGPHQLRRWAERRPRHRRGGVRAALPRGPRAERSTTRPRWPRSSRRAIRGWSTPASRATGASSATSATRAERP